MRFRTFYNVAERILKASQYVSSFLDSHVDRSDQAAYSDLRRAANVDGTVTGCPENRGCV